MFTRLRTLACMTLVVAPLLTSCSTFVDSRVDAALLEALPKVLGPAARYDVHVEGSTAGARHIDVVHVRGYRVQRALSPIIDTLTIDLKDVSVDRANRSFTSIGEANGSVTVTAADLQAYLSQHPRFASVTVAFAPPDAIEMQGNLKVPLAPADAVQVRFAGRLVPNGPRLNLAIGEIGANGLRAPAAVRGVIEAIVNPLFDLSSYAVPAVIEAVELQPAALTVRVSGSNLIPAAR